MSKAEIMDMLGLTQADFEPKEADDKSEELAEIRAALVELADIIMEGI